jgi:hypothetical protein
MYPNDQYFLVIGAIEYPDLPAFGKPARRSPEKIMSDSSALGCLRLET